MANESKTSNKTRSSGPRTAARAGGIALRGAGFPAPLGAGGDGGLLGLAADASGQLENIAPTFGNHGV